MQSYEFSPNMKIAVPEINVSAKAISYGDMVFKNFSAREIYIDGKLNGEYHIKLRRSDKYDIRSMLYFFTERLPGCDVNLIDPTNSLNLEYQIYIKTSDILKIDCMASIFESLDGDLN
jgi:hypothetical protein